MDPFRLVGTWDFRREIRHADGAEYSADGEARFSVEDDGRVRWAEHGTLRWAAGTTPVTRTLFVVREAGRDGGAVARWRVTFEDGRDFHPWTAGAVEHLCGRDLYQGGIEVPARPTSSWELRWHVTGPEKDYLMHTWYTER
ncbi:DUF6314 family protein [Promicromonospora sukumoe]|uniref:DUF6314 family protein n=1 Tax=Promicromonospora sukumoe TaxID=88382 RepID=UPI0012F87D48|nr:DUF6314 family protein [Promicromonospora sukumoe]